MDARLPRIPAFADEDVFSGSEDEEETYPPPPPPHRQLLPIETCELIIDFLAEDPGLMLIHAEHDPGGVPDTAFVYACKSAGLGFLGLSTTSWRPSRLVLGTRSHRSVAFCGGDPSWVSCVPFLLPLELESLRLDGDIDLSLLHPAACSRFELLKYGVIGVFNVKYTRYSQVARFAGRSALKATWTLLHTDPDNGGVIRGKRTTLKEIKVTVPSPTTFVTLAPSHHLFIHSTHNLFRLSSAISHP
ncbi:hypothetical protein EIP91_006920 [Steccherinum ochraceum]|uniref:Uncharacterized protein n=1 Tax=Steccherinum ochraceum TaxID=92696 RepID=A0A4R0RDA5_9APHY|nr:hypothetical protein EIP91_006920 [Steccherinum ochraceum]